MLPTNLYRLVARNVIIMATINGVSGSLPPTGPCRGRRGPCKEPREDPFRPEDNQTMVDTRQTSPEGFSLFTTSTQFDWSWQNKTTGWGCYGVPCTTESSTSQTTPSNDRVAMQDQSNAAAWLRIEHYPCLAISALVLLQ